MSPVEVPSVELNKIRELTFEYCGEWTLNHADRLLKLIEIIAEDQEYDHRLVWIAAHMHDWGHMSHLPNQARTMQCDQEKSQVRYSSR